MAGRAAKDDVYNRRWVERIRKRCVVTERGCWEFQGCTLTKGYGQSSYRAVKCRVHRKMYEVVHFVTLTAQQVVCHSCDVRSCCNPDHLWVGLTAENNRDMADKYRCKHSPGRYTHCKRGHEFTPENTAPGPLNRRVCRQCALGRQRIRAGWSADLAYSHPAVPHGHRVGNGKWRARKSQGRAANE